MTDKPTQCRECYRVGQCSEHLCWFMSQGFHLVEREEYQALVTDPQYRCERCRLTAHRPENLCVPARR